MSGAAYFTHLDLVKGYWQISVEEDAREKTVFSTVDGHYQFKRMPFGLTNAPATFQRVMNTILRGLNWLDCLVYLDDIIIFANTLEDHHKKLDTVLGRLENAGLKLNAGKCKILSEETVILGHVVSRHGIATDPEKTKALKEWPTPCDLTSLRSFLGCAGYYRQFIPNYADIAAPLHRLEQKGAQYHWSKECQTAFITLKEKLTTAPVLAYPRADTPFIVDTDASNVGLGAVLSQVQDGKERVISFAAKALSKAERNYSTTRKELLAMVWGLEYFEPYLWGNSFTARTDHNALKWLRSFKNPKGQVARWLERLSEFHFTVEHRAGRLHGNADGMSRIPSPDLNIENRVSAVASNTQTTMVNNMELAQYQAEDKPLSQAISWVKEGKRPPREEIAGLGPFVSSLWSQFSRLKLVSGILYREYESEDGKSVKLQLCLPRKLISEVLRALHDLPTSGHLGINKMTERVKERYYWKGWRDDVEEHCNSCKQCAKYNPSQRKARAPLVTSTTGCPMERVALDVIGPLPESKQGNRFILVITDYFTKWPEAYAIPDHKAQTVASKLVNEWITRYGVMQSLHSDQGRDFESEVFQSVVRLLGVKKTRTTPYHPQSDGLVERINRTLKNMLSKIVSQDQSDWDLWIPQVLLAYRTAIQSSTGVTPFRMMFGREARLPVDLVVGDSPDQPSQNTSEFVKTLQERFNAAHELAREKMEVATRRYRDYYNLTATGEPYEVGDRVWRMVHATKKGVTKKLAARWEGPYVVVKKITDVVYRLRKEGSGKRVVVHFNNLKKCHTPRDNRRKSDSSMEPRIRTSFELQSAKSRLSDDEDDEQWFFRNHQHRQTENLAVPRVEDLTDSGEEAHTNSGVESTTGEQISETTSE